MLPVSSRTAAAVGRIGNARAGLGAGASTGMGPPTATTEHAERAHTLLPLTNSQTEVAALTLTLTHGCIQAAGGAGQGHDVVEHQRVQRRAADAAVLTAALRTRVHATPPGSPIA